MGFFDGVHLGHKALLEGADRALTFSAHPLSVIAPDRAPVLLMTIEERLAAIRACGVGDVTVLEFDAAFAAREPEDFARDLLALAERDGHAGRMTPSGAAPRLTVRCGENWRFGRGGRGDAALLRALGIGVEVVPYATWAGERVSSSRIRRALAEGCLAEANAMLGRPYAVSGRVVGGKGVGRTLGFPTVNIDPGRPTNLRRGVYAVEMEGERGVANYGLAPTMGAAAWPHPVLEVHLFGNVAADDAIRSVRFLDFLRPERTFDSTEALKRQIAEDCKQAKGAMGK